MPEASGERYGARKNTIRLRLSERSALKTKRRVEVTGEPQRKPKTGNCIGRAPRRAIFRPEPVREVNGHAREEARLRNPQQQTHTRSSATEVRESTEGAFPGAIELQDSLDSSPKLRRLKNTGLYGKLPERHGPTRQSYALISLRDMGVEKSEAAPAGPRVRMGDGVCVNGVGSLPPIRSENKILVGARITGTKRLPG